MTCFVGFTYLYKYSECRRCSDSNCLFCPDNINKCKLCNIDTKGNYYKVQSN